MRTLTFSPRESGILDVERATTISKKVEGIFNCDFCYFYKSFFEFTCMTRPLWGAAWVDTRRQMQEFIYASAYPSESLREKLGRELIYANANPSESPREKSDRVFYK